VIFSRLRHWLAAGIAAAALVAAGAESELVQCAPEDANALYLFDFEKLSALPYWGRIHSWPEVSGYYSDFLSNEAGRTAAKNTREILVAFNTDFTGAQPPAALIFSVRNAPALERLLQPVKPAATTPAQPAATGVAAPAATLPTAEREYDLGSGLTLQRLAPGIFCLPLNDRAGVIRAGANRGKIDGAVAERIAALPDNALAWLVIDGISDLAPGKKRSGPTDPIENILDNLKGADAVLSAGSGDVGALCFDASLYCVDSTQLAIQIQMVVSFSAPLFFQKDRQLGGELIRAIKITPERGRVSIHCALSGDQVGRLLDFLEQHFAEERAEREARLKARAERVSEAK